jgi:O-antigen/teichoic acid export membrane protein
VQSAEARDDAAAPERALDERIGGGLRWSFVNNILGRLGSVLAGVVLARILAPADYGVYAAALIVLSAILSMNELGVSVAVVRWPGRVDDIAPTVTTIAAVTSGVLFAGCFAVAPAVASALNSPHASTLIRVVSVCVLADGAASVSAALITRAFDQRIRTVIDLGSFVVGTAVSIALAAVGFGAWSMAWGLVVSNVLASGLSIAYAPRRYLPGWNRTTARELLHFGTPLAGGSLLLFFMLNIDYIVVGHVLGAVALGTYLIAFNLSSWPVHLVSTAVRRVSLAGFSRLAEQQSRVGESFARAAGLVLALTLPLAVLIACYAHPLIGFVYGAKWLAAADVLRLLCVLGVTRVFTELAYDFLVALARSRATLWLQIFWCACLVPALVIGAHLGGIVGVAAGHAVVAVGAVVPAYLMTLQRAGVELTRVARALARPVAGCAVIAASSVVVLRLVPAELPELVLGGLAILLYLAVVRKMRHLLRTSDLMLSPAEG